MREHPAIAGNPVTREIKGPRAVAETVAAVAMRIAGVAVEIAGVAERIAAAGGNVNEEL